MKKSIPLRMSSDSSVLRPDNLNYKTIEMHNGRYRMRKVPLNNQSASTIDIQPSSTTLVEWKLPANTVWNLGRSTIDYVINVPLLAAKAKWSFEDTFEICSSIQFCNASGVYLTDLQYANNYVSAVRKLDIEQTEFEGGDYTSELYKAPDMTKNYFPATFPALAVDNLYSASAITGKVAVTAVEPQYTKSTSAVALALNLPRSVPLACFSQTAIGMDRDMIFPEDMYIRMQIAPSNKVVFDSLNHTDPTSTPSAITTIPKISGLILQLAMQVDPVVETSVRQKFVSGEMKFLIPYVYAWKNITSGGAGQISSIQISLNNQFGNRLKRLINVPFAKLDTLNTAYDHQNVGGSKIASYQTFIDSQPLQDAVISCAQPTTTVLGLDDYRENKAFLRGSALENSLVYQMNWLHVDSFSQPKRGKVLVPLENILEGLDLSMPRQWTFTATTPVDIAHHTFGTFVRQIVTSPQGTQVLVA